MEYFTPILQLLWYTVQSESPENHRYRPQQPGTISLRHYLALDLSRNNLHGNIPNDFGKLSKLRVLAINRNNLYGTIPSSIYNISSLTYIRMSTNQLSGELASEMGYSFPKLEILYLGANQFTGKIPSSLANISTLDHLDIHSDDDLEFVSSLINCTRLKELTIHVNRFNGVLPHSVANLSNQIEILYMGGNRISGDIPQGIGNLVMLSMLHLGDNLLTDKIPKSKNDLSGEFPSSISNLSQLIELYLDGNNLEERIPLSLMSCTDFSTLDLSSNKLHGGLSNQLIGAFKRLIALNFYHNSFSGVFPSDVVKSKDLDILYVNNNNFIGEISSQISQISALRILQFHGSIPSSFGFLRGIESLDLSANNLSTTIPVQLQKLQFLVNLNLSFNHLQGQVPREGVFKSTSQFSVIGNQNLYDGIPKIKLLRCSEDQKARKPL